MDFYANGAKRKIAAPTRMEKLLDLFAHCATSNSLNFPISFFYDDVLENFLKLGVYKSMKNTFLILCKFSSGYLDP